MTQDARPVVVGVDGSAAAISAALWAVDEAVDRDVPLRLVYATGSPSSSSAPYAANDIAVEYGEAALRGASAAISETGRTVKVETEILWGPVKDALFAESKDAAMLCLASVGIGWVAKKLFGSTAAALAHEACCPVAIVRYPRRTKPAQPHAWIVVSVDDRSGNDDLVSCALEEARLRNAALLAVATWSCELGGVSLAEVDQRCQTWAQSYPDVHIRPAVTGGGLPEYMVQIRDRNIELLVIGPEDADKVPQIIGPHHRPLIPYGQCSVLVVH
jgi:nucleotide-binding universal stress UspA family protein